MTLNHNIVFHLFKQENRDWSKDGGALNQYTLSPASDSSYHIYEMADLEASEESQKPQAAADKSKNSTSSCRTQALYLRGSGSYKYKKSPYHKHAPPRRYNSVSAYEFMKPQLQASAARMKQTRVPVNMDDPYSEITDEGESQQSDTYIFMQPEEPSDEFSSFLSKWFDTDKDTTTEQNTGTKDQALSQVSEDSVYITML